MNQPQLPLAEPYLNQGLFADHFLRERLQELPEWESTGDMAAAFDDIRLLYQQRATGFGPHANEAQTQHDFIEPVLDRLWTRGTYQVQVSIPNLDARRQPDYALFRTQTDRDAVQGEIGTLEYWRDVPVLGDAKAWNASLDKRRAADENPSAQIANYLYRSRVRWGILTNGRAWRLYEREKSSAGGIFFEVDLEGILQRGDLQAFKYFYLFFRRDAVVPTPDGRTFLEKVFEGSVEYATRVGDRLKESVYDALRLLMSGFFEHTANKLDRSDPATLRLVHENSLIVLYRLLFLLFAEDRGLLPRQREPYASNSLYRIQREINLRLRTGRPYLRVGRAVWGALTGLFELIDSGHPAAGVPEYNGGLFNVARHPHIAHTPQPGEVRWEIADERLASAVDMLAYERERWDEPGSRDVDYKTLDVQHLGSIYEGLLELEPVVADEPLIETLLEGRAVFRPETEVQHERPVRGVPPRRIATDEVYLVTNRGERKASGSYYTPKFIVDYIVERTLSPLLERAAEEVAHLRPRVDRQVEELERQRRQEIQALGTAAAHVAAKYDRLVQETRRGLLEPYLALKVLDPAMGSGHFLVGAADFLSLAMATDPHLPAPEEMGHAASEDPQAFYKRLGVERCLYGVDLNPLSVELAKLSLWLHTVSSDRALSFLDHHLRCGNSLMGARVEDDLSKAPPRSSGTSRRQTVPTRSKAQLSLAFTDALTATHLQYLLDTFRQIMESPSGSADAERHKEKLYRALDAERDRFRQVANCWLSAYFGIDITAEQYDHAVEALRGPAASWDALAALSWFQDAQNAAAARRFFHWELEFPEAYFEPHRLKPAGQRGFDAVVGNPPWERIKLADNEFFARRCPAIAQAPRAVDRKRLIQSLPQDDPELWSEYERARSRAEELLSFVHGSGHYPLMGRGDTNYYAVFAERAMQMTNSLGRTGLLVPSPDYS